MKQSNNSKKGDTMNNLTEAQAMEILHDIAHAYLDFFPLTKAGKEDIKSACNLGISALKTIEDMKGDKHD